MPKVEHGDTKTWSFLGETRGMEHGDTGFWEYGYMGM